MTEGEKELYRAVWAAAYVARKEDHDDADTATYYATITANAAFHAVSETMKDEDVTPSGAYSRLFEVTQ